MKKTLNIISVADLAVLALWAITLAVSRLTAETEISQYFAAAFVILYIAAIIVAAAYTVTSIVLFIKKKEFSFPLVFFTYVMNIAFVAVTALVIDYVKTLF